MFLGKNLRYLRKKAGLRQEDIAKIVDKDFTTIQKWETEKSEPSLLLTAIMANFFNVNLDDFVRKDLEADFSAEEKLDPFEKLKSALKVLKDEGEDDVTQITASSYKALQDVCDTCMNLYLSQIE